MAVGEQRWTFVLEPTGKVEALARVTRTADERFELDTDAGLRRGLLARINRFKIRVKADTSLVAAADTAGSDTAGPDDVERDRIATGWPPHGRRDRAGRGDPGWHRSHAHRRRASPRVATPARSWSSGWTAAQPRHRSRCDGSRSRTAPRRATRSSTTAPRSACSPASPARTAIGWVKRTSDVGDGRSVLTALPERCGVVRRRASEARVNVAS